MAPEPTEDPSRSQASQHARPGKTEAIVKSEGDNRSHNKSSASTKTTRYAESKRCREETQHVAPVGRRSAKGSFRLRQKLRSQLSDNRDVVIGEPYRWQTAAKMAVKTLRVIKTMIENWAQ